VQHTEEPDVVPLGLIGQRWPPSMFMSAQQECFCRIVGTESFGRTGVNEATLIARRANKIRADVIIGTNVITNGTFSKLARSTSRFDCGIKIVDAEPDRDFVGNGCRSDRRTDVRLAANLHRCRRACAKSV
jgi:hypothetical protein